MFVKALIGGGVSELSKANSRRNQNASPREGFSRKNDPYIRCNTRKDDARFLNEQIREGLEMYVERKLPKTTQLPKSHTEFFSSDMLFKTAHIICSVEFSRKPQHLAIAS